MMKSPAIRIALDLLLFVAVIEGWWFVAIPLALAGAWMFPFYAEMVVAGLAYDSLFGSLPGEGVSGYYGTMLSVALVLATAAMKRVIRKY